MSVVRRITKNTLVLNTARIISTLGKFFLFIWVARVLGDGVLGQFTFAIIFTSFFGIVISLGMDDYLVREVARNPGSSARYVGGITFARLVLSALVFAALVVTINVMDYPQDTRLAVYIFGGYTVVTAFSFLYRANFRAFEKMEWDALLETLEAVFTTGAGLLVVVLGYGLVALSLVFLAAAVLNLVVSMIISARKFVLPRLYIKWGFLWQTLIKAAPFSVFALFIVYPRIDTILLSSIKGDEVVGGYNAAYQIVMAFSPVVMNFMIALVPLISRYFLNSRTMLHFTYQKSFKYLVMISLPVSVGGTVLAGHIIPFLYGPGFGDSVLALQILIWNCLIMAMNRPTFYVLGAINRQGTCALITMAALALSIALNYAAVPVWSFVGSGAITLFVGGLVTLAGWAATSRFGFRLPVMKLVLPSVAASLMMGAVVFALDRFTASGLLPLLAAGALSYAVFIVLFRGIGADDRDLLKQAARLVFRRGKANEEESSRVIRNTAVDPQRRTAER